MMVGSRGTTGSADETTEVGQDRLVTFGFFYDGHLKKYVVQRIAHTVIGLVDSAAEAQDFVTISDGQQLMAIEAVIEAWNNGNR